MPRMPLTAGEARKLRHLLRKAGQEHLLPLLSPDLQPHRRGRLGLDNAPLLESLELFVRATVRSYGISREAALRVFVIGIWHLNRHYERGRFGISTDAVVARLGRKLQALEGRDARTLVPREWLEQGVDPEKFVSFPVTTDLRKIDPREFLPRKQAKLKRIGGSLGRSQYVVVESDEG